MRSRNHAYFSSLSKRCCSGRPSAWRPANRSAISPTCHAYVCGGCPSSGSQRITVLARAGGMPRLAWAARPSAVSEPLDGSATGHARVRSNIERSSGQNLNARRVVGRHVCLRQAACPVIGQSATRTQHCRALRTRGAAVSATCHRRAFASHWANPSVERTANGGAHWRASSPTAAPLSAAHLKR